MNIGNYTFEEFLQKVRAFHGNPAGGVVLGGIMVDIAQRNLPKDSLFDAICETDKCLPDSIQMLTPCTIGNGWMRIINSGRFALALYDKRSGAGVRVFVDAAKVKQYKELNNWFFSLIPKKEQDRDRLTAEIKNHGADILSLRRVQVDIAALPNKEIAAYAICRVCGESHLAEDGDVCLSCQGKTYISEVK